MKLSFGTQFNGKPNYFIEKIWKGIIALSSSLETDYYQYQQRHIHKFGTNWEGDQYTEFLEPKLHTIRADKEGLWNPGTEITMVIDKDTPEEFQFAPMLRCISTQELIIRQEGNRPAEVYIDGTLLDINQLEQLAINDGFHESTELITYFSGNFHGKLVHWTAMKY